MSRSKRQHRGMYRCRWCLKTFATLGDAHQHEGTKHGHNMPRSAGRLLLALECNDGCSGETKRAIAELAAALSQPSEEGWIKVTAENPIPTDLQADDEIAMNYETWIGGMLGATAYRRASGER